MPIIVNCEKLTCQAGRRYLVHNINWQIKEGEHWVVFGLNGCGKTTLLSIIAGFKGYQGGKLEVFGQQYSENNIFELRRRIGWVSSSFFDKYLSWESALSIVLAGASGTLGVRGHIDNCDVKRAVMLLEKLWLKEKIDQPFALMSKGERQRVLLARALLKEPELLILDEPTTGLDIYAKQYILTAIDDLAKNTHLTIVYVTHYVEEILPTFNQALLMKNGRIYQKGLSKDLFTDEAISHLIDYPVKMVGNGGKGWRVELAVEASFRGEDNSWGDKK